MKGLLIFFVFLTGCFLGSNLVIAKDTQSEKLARDLLEIIEQNKQSNNWDTLYHNSLDLLKIASEEKLAYYEGKSNYYLGLYFSNISNYDTAIYYFEKAKIAFRVCRDTLNMGKAVTNIAVEYKMKGDIEKALLNYHKGSDLLEMVGDTIWYGYANNHMGMTYFRQGNYIPALKHLKISIEAFTKSGNMKFVGVATNALGVIYRKTEDKEKEEEAYLKAISILKEMDVSIDLGKAYNNLAEIYFDRGEIDKGFKTLEKAKEVFEASNYPLGLCSYYEVQSYYYLETVEIPQYDKVIELCLKSLKIAEEYEGFRQYADVTSYLGIAYLETNQLQEAKRILEKGLSVAKKYDYKHEVVKITEVLSRVYEKSNQPQKALDYLREFIAIKDSIVGEEKIKEFTQLDLEFKYKHQQQQDSLNYIKANLERDFQHKKEIQGQKQILIVLAFISALIFVVAFFMFMNARKNKKQVQVLSEKNAQIEKQKIEIETYATQIQEAYIKLQKLDEHKQAMTNMLVHDLKNPLNLLVNIEAIEDELEKRLIVMRTSKQMLNLIMNLLDVSKAEHNKLILNKTKVNLVDIIQPALEEVDYLCMNKKITIQNNDSLDYRLNADREILMRVFINFLTNAIKFSPLASTIFITTKITQDKLFRIAIKDNGIGIAKENSELIFEKFYQIESREYGSTGLGLAFCKMAIESHNWNIGVDSELGKGAEFWITMDDYEIIS